jgi:hypothetical protein
VAYLHYPYSCLVPFLYVVSLVLCEIYFGNVLLEVGLRIHMFDLLVSRKMHIGFVLYASISQICPC